MHVSSCSSQKKDNHMMQFIVLVQFCPPPAVISRFAPQLFNACLLMELTIIVYVIGVT